MLGYYNYTIWLTCLGMASAIVGISFLMDDDIVRNSKEKTETLVRQGERIGIAASGAAMHYRDSNGDILG